VEEGKRAMEPKQVSRRGFLASAGKLAAGAAAGAVGLSMLAGSQAEAAEAYPWQYPGLDPARVEKLAVELYGKYGCGRGSFEALLTELGAPFNSVPAAMLGFGGGGIASWGSHCGALLGSSCVINLVYPDSKVANKLITELNGWYTEFLGYGSALCHVSSTMWAQEHGVRIDSAERKQRCAVLTGEVARKTAELMNAEKNSAFGALFGPRWNVVECHSCHGVGQGAMGDILPNTMSDCTPCHGDPHKS
jgi:hypothetical protein